MQTQSRIRLSVVSSIAVSIVIAFLAFSVLRGMKAELARIQTFREIIKKTLAMHVLTASFKEGSGRSDIRQVKGILQSLEATLNTLTAKTAREVVLLNYLQKSHQELGPLIDELFDSEHDFEGIEKERRSILTAQIWMKVQLISDDTNRLNDISQARIVTAQARAFGLVIALILILALASSAIYFLSGRGIVRSQEALRESEERLRAFLENSAVIGWLKDEDGRYVFLSKNVEQRFDMSRAEWLGKTDFEVFSKEVAEEFRRNDQAVLASTEPIEVIEYTTGKDGRLTWWLSHRFSFRDAAGRRYTGGLGVDITERKRAEEEREYLIQSIDEKRSQLQAIMNSIPAGVFIADARGKLLEANDYAKKIWGGTVPLSENWQEYAEYKGWWPDTGTPLAAEDWATTRALTKGETILGDVVDIERFDGSRGTLLNCASPVKDAGGNVIGSITINIDITDHKRVQQELRHLNDTLEQQVADRTKLAEFRTKQLRALAVELIESEEKERRRIAHLLHEDLQQMLAAAKMQLRGISDRLQYEQMVEAVDKILEQSIAKSRQLTHELSPTVLQTSGIVTALQWLGKRMEEQFGLEVDVKASFDREILNESVKIFVFRAVQELLFNVVKHAGVKSAHVNISINDGALITSVSDNGKGFDPEIVDNPSDRSGFGLLTIQERANYIGGGLAIESVQGKGSSVVLTLPLLPAQARDMHPQPAAATLASTPEDRDGSAGQGVIRILFADDHHVMRQGLIKLLMGQPDINVVGEAADGQEAVELARKLKPDLIVMDVSMPVMDGIEATRLIKADLPFVRVVGLSMFEDEHVAQAMLQAGAEAFLSKTESAPVLLKAIYGVGKEQTRAPYKIL